MAQVGIAMAFVLVGALLFAWGVQAHQYAMIALGVLCLATAGIFGSRGSIPRDDGHSGHY